MMSLGFLLKSKRTLKEKLLPCKIFKGPNNFYLKLSDRWKNFFLKKFAYFWKLRLKVKETRAWCDKYIIYKL